MNAKQFQIALDRLGFTQSSFARTIDISDRMVRRWAAGEWPVPTQTAMLLNLMLKTESTAEDLKA